MLYEIKEKFFHFIYWSTEELSHIEGSKGGSEEIPLVQGKEQRLCFA